MGWLRRALSGGEGEYAMRKTRFIFLEGIMGSGKTTTALFLTHYLQQNGIAAGFMPEGPSTGMTEHPLRVATALPHPFAVWQDVTVDEYIALSLRKWHAFVKARQQSEIVTICDGLLFHGNMTDLLLMDAPPVVLHDYVVQVIDQIQALDPLVIYFYHDDVDEALRTVSAARGAAWESYQVNWKVRSPYGSRRSLDGFAGLVELYQAYRAICDDMFRQLTLAKLAIRNEGNWAAHYQAILAFLQLPIEPPGVIDMGH